MMNETQKDIKCKRPLLAMTSDSEEPAYSWVSRLCCQAFSQEGHSVT